jgi:hypothetical protein
MNSTSKSDSSDRSVKRLSQEILQAAQDDNTVKTLLRENGLLDWVKYDHINSDDPIELAADLLIFLFKPEKFAERIILAGILAYLGEEGCNVIPTQLPRLKRILEMKPLNEGQIRDWFRNSFEC